MLRKLLLFLIASQLSASCDKSNSNDTYPSVLGVWVSGCIAYTKDGKTIAEKSHLEITDNIIIRTHYVSEDPSCSPLTGSRSYELKFDKLDKSNGNNWVGTVIENGKETKFVMTRNIAAQEDVLITSVYWSENLSEETAAKLRAFHYKRYKKED